MCTYACVECVYIDVRAYAHKFLRVYLVTCTLYILCEYVVLCLHVLVCSNALSNRSHV